MPPWESRQKLCNPNVGRPVPACQLWHACRRDLDITNVQRVFSFNPPCREDRGGAIDLEFVFGVVKYLDPRLVSRESYWVGDTNRSVNGHCGLEWAHRGWAFASISSIRSSIVAMAPDGYIPCITFLWGVVGWCEGAVYLTSLGRPTDIGLQLGKACYPCSG